MTAIKRFTDHDVVVGRIISEDDKFAVVEILKDNDETFTLRNGDRFVTLIFTAGKWWLD